MRGTATEAQWLLSNSCAFDCQQPCPVASIHNTPASATMAAGMAPGESGADSCVTGASQGAQVVS